MTACRFILLSTQRSGSTWVVDSLSSHPEITCHGELLLEGGNGTPPFGSRTRPFWESVTPGEVVKATPEVRQSRLFEFLDDVYAFDRGESAIGFKLMYGQYGAYPELASYIRDKAVSVLHLIRENLLNVFISRELAYSRDVYHLQGTEQVESCRIELDTTGLLGRLEAHASEVERMRQAFGKAPVPYMEIIHEEMHVSARPFRAVLEFLEVADPGVNLQSALRRINTAAQKDVIANYPDVIDTLRGTRFDRYLEME